MASQAEAPPPHFPTILCLTSFAAGSVDIISFAKLGGILASAMTGNLAFLGFYLSRGSFDSALGSLTALIGFVCGCAAGTLLGRNRGTSKALRLLLGLECVLLFAAIAVWLPTHHYNGSLSGNIIIALLATAMGLQIITGKRINLSSIPTVVFTSTLTNIVIALTNMTASRKSALPPDIRLQVAAFLLYFSGAFGAGLCVYWQLQILIWLPGIAAAIAFGLHLKHCKEQ